MTSVIIHWHLDSSTGSLLNLLTPPPCNSNSQNKHSRTKL